MEADLGPAPATKRRRSISTTKNCSASIPPRCCLTSETIPDDPASWQLEAYFEARPGAHSGLALACWRSRRCICCICGRRAYATASDIDLVAVEVTRENAAVNGIALAAAPASSLPC